jgi:hypothetical protein
MKHRSHTLLWWSALASVSVVLVKVLLAGISLKMDKNSIIFGNIDGGLVAALLTPTLTALVAAGHAALRGKDTDGDGKPDSR